MTAKDFVSYIDDLSRLTQTEIKINGEEVFEVRLTISYQPKSGNSNAIVDVMDKEHCQPEALPQILRIQKTN